MGLRYDFDERQINDDNEYGDDHRHAFGDNSDNDKHDKDKNDENEKNQD